MNLKKIKTKTFFASLVLTTTSIICSGCKLNKEIVEDKISYDDLVTNYKVVELVAFDKHNFHIVQKKHIEDSCYGYYDIIYDECLIKVDEEAGSIIGKGFVDNVIEHGMEGYLETYNAICDGYTIDDLGYIISWIREDYDEKVLVKERD